MRKFLFEILVILLTPIYLIIQVQEWIMELISPIAEEMCNIIENMTEFWKKIFIKERGELSEFSKKN